MFYIIYVMRNKMKESKWKDRKGTITHVHTNGTYAYINKENYIEKEGKITLKDIKKRMKELKAYCVEYAREYSRDQNDIQINYLDEEGNTIETNYAYVKK